MENKSEAIRREVLKSIIERYNGRGKATIIRLVKEKGVYKNFVDDLEVWELVKKFAEFHKLPLTDEDTRTAAERIWEDYQPETIPLKVEEIEVDEDDEFLKLLKEEHARLSKRLLALNRVIEVYEKQ